jgi:PAS domain S-box-containing protein
MEDAREVLIVHAAGADRDRLEAIVSRGGYATSVAGSLDEAASALDTRSPCLVVLAAALGEDGGAGLLARLRSSDGGSDTPLILLTAIEPATELSRVLEAGADDFVALPVRDEELLARIASRIRIRDDVHELARKERDAHVMLELTQALASSLDLREILFTVVRRIAEFVRVDRASIVLAPQPEQGDVGYVVVASDDEKLSNLKIDLAKYPEIQQVLRTGQPLAIRDVATHPILDGVRDDVQSHKVASMALLPIVWQDQTLGVLFLRAATKRGTLSERDLGLCRIVANATAVALRNARVMQSLRDHTQQVTFARFEAERKLRSLERYEDLFASSADGIAVVDADGQLLFANPRAYQLLNYPPDGFRGEKVKHLIDPEDAELARAIWDGFADGRFPHDIDIRLRRHQGSSIIANVSFSSLLHGEGAVLFTFRDVTEARRMENELVQTKEFLESLVHASPDGIVAADAKGNIILFNEGAERIYGYRADDVIGKINVRTLYPDNGAYEVMAMMRSAQHGGVGRLESTRLDALSSRGERVPISLSGAIIYERNEVVATFGIFTDLRERLRVEERLAQAQQKLAMTEKQALIAELAGTAAHELNQPLTSVMGYAELLKRKLDRESSEHHAADIIVREAERMADIVRKIGKITKYETKSYVGRQKILDLDKASGSGSGGTTIPPDPPSTARKD